MVDYNTITLAYNLELVSKFHCILCGIKQCMIKSTFSGLAEAKIESNSKLALLVQLAKKVSRSCNVLCV